MKIITGYRLDPDPDPAGKESTDPDPAGQNQLSLN